MIEKMIQKFDKIYYNNTFKLLYTAIGSGITLLLFLGIPLVIKEVKYLPTLLDLLLRFFLVYGFGNFFYYVSRWDEYYRRFYKGLDPFYFPKPDGLKQIVNIVASIAAGFIFFINYRGCLHFLLPSFGVVSTIISAVLSVCVSIPLLFQYKKR